MNDVRQRFSFGYHLNSWDLGGLELEPGLRFLAESGFGWFEALSRDGFSNDFARRFMRVGEVEPIAPDTDVAWLERIALFSRIQEELGLRVSSLYCNVELINGRTWEHERDCLQAIARMLHGFGSPGLVIGGGPPAVPGRPHTDDQYDGFAAALDEIGSAIAQLGMWTAYHPHLDTFVQTRDELDRVMDRLDTGSCGLCIDPAHLVLTGSDPVAIVRDYGAAVRYMHYKDTRLPEGAVGGERYAAFCELGAGAVDLKGITAELLRQEYDGLAIIELDVSAKTAEASAEESIAYIRDELDLELTPAPAPEPATANDA
jgi:inosose dehydratase